MPGGDEWCTKTPHLKGEKVFVSLKRKLDIAFGDERESHRLDKTVYPDHASKPNLLDWTILHIQWQLQILLQLQMKNNRNFQHTTLRSSWIGTTSPQWGDIMQPYLVAHRTVA